MQEKAREIDHRIREMKRYKVDLLELHDLGLTFPIGDVEGKNCVCHLISEGVILP